jgi:non-homologous end joining protein Ku
MQPLTSATSAGVTLSFGMIAVAVSVHGAVGEDDSRSMKIVCEHGHAATPVKQRLTCGVIYADGTACGNDGSEEPFTRARQVGDGFVVIPPEVIEKDKEASAVFKKSIALSVHPLHEVTSVLMPSGKSYYLSIKAASASAVLNYTLLSRLVTDNPDKAFMAKFTLRSATSLFQLVSAGAGTLVLRQMADADLVREHPSIPFADLDERTLELAGMLAEQQLTPFLVAEHGSGKSSIIADYAASQTPVTPVDVASVAKPEATASATVSDLTAALEAMLAPTSITAPTKRKRAPRKAAAAVEIAQAS